MSLILNALKPAAQEATTRLRDYEAQWGDFKAKLADYPQFADELAALDQKLADFHAFGGEVLQSLGFSFAPGDTSDQVSTLSVGAGSKDSSGDSGGN